MHTIQNLTDERESFFKTDINDDSHVAIGFVWFTNRFVKNES